MSGPTTFKARIALSASLTIITLAISGCSLTGKKPDVAATAEQNARPASAAEAMQQAAIAKQKQQAQSGATAYVDPLVSARPGQNSQNQGTDGQNVRDFRSSGRSAMAAMRSNTPAPANPEQLRNPAATASVPELSESALAGVVTQPTGIQAGRNSIFSASAAPASDVSAATEAAGAPHVTSATGSLSTDAVAYAPVRRISGTTGGLFAGGPQLAANTESNSQAAAATHSPPGIATRPTVPAAAEPVAQGLW